MGKMSELDLCVGELRNAAHSLNVVADSLTAFFSGNDSEPEAAAQSTQLAPNPKSITLEQVRAVLAEKSRVGHTAKVRELLEKHGAAKLSEIDPKEYAVLIKEAEALGNG